MQASAQLSVSYIAPGPVSSRVTLAGVMAYTASAVGFLDIPEATADETAFSIPFGSVGAAKGIIIQNNCVEPLDVTINASLDTFELAPGATLALFGPEASGITSASVVTTGVTAADGSVAYIVMGDDVTP